MKKIFEENELEENSVCRKFRHTGSDGKSYDTKFYSLDAIISVGYRVNSICATQFRQWATKVLRTYTVQGYVLDKKRLENGQILMKNTLITYWMKFVKLLELEDLNQFVSMYLDYAERQAKKRIPMTMEDWAKKLDVFLSLNDEVILQGKGKVTAEIAKAFAESEFEKYRAIQDKCFKSDFDKLFRGNIMSIC